MRVKRVGQGPGVTTLLGKTVMGSEQLSVAVNEISSGISLAHWITRSAGAGGASGGVVSTTSMVWVHSVTRPQSSVAAQVRRMVSSWSLLEVAWVVC